MNASGDYAPLPPLSLCSLVARHAFLLPPLNVRVAERFATLDSSFSFLFSGRQQYRAYIFAFLLCCLRVCCCALPACLLWLEGDCCRLLCWARTPAVLTRTAAHLRLPLASGRNAQHLFTVAHRYVACTVQEGGAPLCAATAPRYAAPQDPALWRTWRSPRACAATLLTCRCQKAQPAPPRIPCLRLPAPARRRAEPLAAMTPLRCQANALVTALHRAAAGRRLRCRWPFGHPLLPSAWACTSRTLAHGKGAQQTSSQHGGTCVWRRSGFLLWPRRCLLLRSWNAP